jgi:hypothetical protein
MEMIHVHPKVSLGKTGPILSLLSKEQGAPGLVCQFVHSCHIKSLWVRKFKLRQRPFFNEIGAQPNLLSFFLLLLMRQ